LVRFWGGNGQDNLSTIYSGFLAGSATFVSDGGNGKDNVSGEITLNTFEFVELPGELFPSTGSLRAWMRGNNGVDNIGLNVAGDEGLTKSSLVVNGGHAKDTFSLPTLENDNICIVDQPGDKKNT
jgi:hypothetical protein